MLKIINAFSTKKNFFVRTIKKSQKIGQYVQK